MGNPASQSRSNSPKTSVKLKHRHSGSVSNVSVTPEDPKPKHRHSGSVSNISFTPEDLKPKHRHSGSVSNISFSSEDPKPKHRHSGSVSSISLTTPEDLKPKHRPGGSGLNASITPPLPEDSKDLKPKHRRTGSVSSSITSNADDFTSFSRGNVSRSGSTSSSGPSSLPAASVKERRNKRRTRSSLGGTEDFVKELDFLTTSPNGKSLGSIGTSKELSEPSPSAPLSRPACLEAAAEALIPGCGASVALEAELGEPLLPIGQPNVELEKANVVENGESTCAGKLFVTDDVGDGGSPHGEESSATSRAEVGENGGCAHVEKSISNAEAGENGGSAHEESVASAEAEIVHPSGAAHSTEAESNGFDVGFGTSVVELQSGSDGQGACEVLDCDLSEVDDGSDEADHETLETLPTLENGQLLETSVSPLAIDVQELERNEPADVWKDAEEVVESVAERELASEFVDAVTVAPNSDHTTKQQNGFTESENNSELSVAGGANNSFANGDAQISPSEDGKLAQEEQAAKDTRKEEKISVQKRIEELEKISGGRPVHFRSQSLSLPRPFEVPHARHHEAEGANGFNLPAYRAPLDNTVVSEGGGPELVGSSHEGLSQEREGPVSTPATGLDSAEEIGSQEVPAFSEAHMADGVSPESTGNGMHLESRTISDSCDSLHANDTESMAVSVSTDVAEAPGDTMEEKEVGTKMGTGIGSGRREAHVMVSGDAVPEGLPSQASAIQTQEHGGKLEVLEPGILKLETSAEADQSGTLPEAAETGLLADAHQRSASIEVPSAEVSVAEQSTQDYETTMLLTKQPALDPLFVDSQQDRLWEMHSQELAIEETSGQEVRESSAQDDDPRQYLNGTTPHADGTSSGSAANGNAQADKSSKVDRPRTPLRSLLAEEDAEKCPDTGSLGTPPQNQSASPRGNLFKRIVSGGKNSPTKQTTPSKFSPKNQTVAKPFLSSCMCCSVK